MRRYRSRSPVRRTVPVRKADGLSFRICSLHYSASPGPLPTFVDLLQVGCLGAFRRRRTGSLGNRARIHGRMESTPFPLSWIS